MSVTYRQIENDIWLVNSKGRLDQSLNPQLEITFVELLDNEHQNFMVDLSEVTYINSSGLRCLVTAWRRARAQGGDLVLFGLNSRLQEIFSMVGFDQVFPIYPAFDDALNHDYP